jgi:hypothetical protein
MAGIWGLEGKTQENIAGPETSSCLCFHQGQVLVKEARLSCWDDPTSHGLTPDVRYGHAQGEFCLHLGAAKSCSIAMLNLTYSEQGKSITSGH